MHFQEVSDIISEEDENQKSLQKQTPSRPQHRLSGDNTPIQPQMVTSPDLNERLMSLTARQGENLHTQEESPKQLPLAQEPTAASYQGATLVTEQI